MTVRVDFLGNNTILPIMLAEIENCPDFSIFTLSDAKVRL